MNKLVPVFALTALLSCLNASAQSPAKPSTAKPAGPNSELGEWTEFRGVGGYGLSSAKGLPVTWSETENVLWKTPIHGKGWASPVILDGQIWLATATVDGKTMSGLCLDGATGRIVHDLVLFTNEAPRFCHPTNSYASCTPTVEKGRVYFHFGSYGTACVDSQSGKTLWTRRDFVSDDFRGPASSPVVFENLLFLTFDGVDFQFVVALDKTTGKDVWRKTRNIDYQTDNGDNKKGYGTPSIIEAEGRVQLVSPAAKATLAYDPRTGEELWKLRHGGMNAAARPLFAHGLVYICAGEDTLSLAAVRPNGDGDITATHVAWSTGKTVPRRGSPLIVGDHLFMMADAGILSCLDAKTGEFLWSKRLPGQYWASPIYADGRLYIPSDDGQTQVVAASDEYEHLASNKLDAGCNATPAVFENSLLIRTKTHLYRIGKK